MHFTEDLYHTSDKDSHISMATISFGDLIYIRDMKHFK